jgi:hypothetical protein
MVGIQLTSRPLHPAGPWNTLEMLPSSHRYLLVALLSVLIGCATAPVIGRGGRVYAVRVASLDGQPTSDKGTVAFPACTLQFGDRVARVWLAHPSRVNAVSPVIVEADEAALKDGILVERSWGEAIVHRVTDAELAAGAAVVYIPSPYHPTVVELRFEPVSQLGHSEHKDDFAEGRAGLENPMARSNVGKR